MSGITGGRLFTQAVNLLAYPGKVDWVQDNELEDD